jgi:signal transduction histidine kinase
MWRPWAIDRRFSSTSLLLVFLVAVLALALGLGYHAVATARSHRDTVEDALRDYASMAAWEFSRITREGLDWVLWRVFDDVPRRIHGGDLPPPSVVARGMERTVRSLRCECRGLRDPIAYFRLNLADRNTVVIPDTLPSGVMEAVADTIAVHQRERGNGRAVFITAEPGRTAEAPVLVAYSVAYSRDAAAGFVYGFLAKPTALTDLLARWYEPKPLLPATIAGEIPNDSLLHLAVYAPAGAAVFESQVDYPVMYAARDTVGTEYGGLIVEVSVRPDAAGHLIIGGLPRSRLPLIVGLFLVTVCVGVAALFQIRREHQLARLRDDFVSGVSHELRTPLAQIRMFAELLDAGKLRTESERKRSINVIDREARRLTHLVENVLQYSRLRWSTEGLAVEKTDVATTMGEVIEVMRPMAESLSVDIRKQVDDNPVVLADRDAVKQVLVNLFDNALKYGPRGQTITVGVTRTGKKVHLFVQDEGPGVPRADRARIWEPYRRLDNSGNGMVGGTGIGLAVVKKLVAVQHGSAWVEEAPGSGARFVVELPASSAASDNGVESQ